MGGKQGDSRWWWRDMIQVEEVGMAREKGWTKSNEEARREREVDRGARWMLRGEVRLVPLVLVSVAGSG